MTWQAKAAAQREEIARLTRQLETERATKREHVFRLRMLLVAALDGHEGWQAKARRELGRRGQVHDQTHS